MGRVVEWLKSVLRAAGLLLGVWYAVFLHCVWAVALLASGAALNATAVHGPALLFPNRYGLALLLAVVAWSAVAGVFMPLGIPKILLLIPQQIMLGLSASAAMYAVVVGHYADGTPRSSLFILADQVPAILALLVHSLSILYIAAELNGWLDGRS